MSTSIILIWRASTDAGDPSPSLPLRSALGLPPIVSALARRSLNLPPPPLLLPVTAIFVTVGAGVGPTPSMNVPSPWTSGWPGLLKTRYNARSGEKTHMRRQVPPYLTLTRAISYQHPSHQDPLKDNYGEFPLNMSQEGIGQSARPVRPTTHSRMTPFL